MPVHHLYTEIDIDAAAERVWSILTAFERFPEWNPFIRKVEGKPQVGSRLLVRLFPGGDSGAMTFRPLVVAVEPGRELRWRGRLLVPRILDGEHRFVIRPLGDHRVVFQQSERFSGLLVPLFRSRLDRDTRRGFEEMNLALKKVAEA